MGNRDHACFYFVGKNNRLNTRQIATTAAEQIPSRGLVLVNSSPFSYFRERAYLFDPSQTECLKSVLSLSHM